MSRPLLNEAHGKLAPERSSFTQHLVVSPFAGNCYPVTATVSICTESAQEVQWPGLQWPSGDVTGRGGHRLVSGVGGSGHQAPDLSLDIFLCSSLPAFIKDQHLGRGHCSSEGLSIGRRIYQPSGSVDHPLPGCCQIIGSPDHQATGLP